MADNNPIHYSDLVAPDSSITDLIKQLEQLISVYDQAKGKIQTTAQQTAQSMQQLSGATAQQQQQVVLLTAETDKLVKEYNDTQATFDRLKAKYNDVTQATKELAKINRDVKKVNDEQEGSYNKLAAMYNLVKRRLNEMSEAQRHGTAEGKKLEQEAKAIYTQMSNLQKATGKYVLEVGHYENALGRMMGVNNQFLTILTDSSKASETFHGVLSALKTPIGALIGVVGAVTAAFKLYKDSVHSTQTTGDALDTAVAGWTANWELFKKAVATVDFSFFINGAVSATKAGVELAKVMDYMFEFNNSMALLKAQQSEELEILQEDMRNQQLSIKDREEAANKYILKMGEFHKLEKEQLTELQQRQLDYAYALSGARDKETEAEQKAGKERLMNFITTIAQNKEMYNQALQYNEALKEREKVIKSSTYFSANITPDLSANDAAIKKYDNFINSAPQQVVEMANVMKEYNNLSDEQIQSLVDISLKLFGSDGEFKRENRRITTLKNSLKAQLNKSSIGTADGGGGGKTPEQIAAEEKAAQEKAEAEAKAAAEREAQEEIKRQRDEIQRKQQTVALKLAVVEKGTIEELQLREEAIEHEKEMEIFENSQKAEAVRQAEADINAKYDKKILDANAKFYTELTKRDLDAINALDEAEFSLAETNEREKTIFRLEMEKQRLQDVLTLNETAVEKMTDMEVEAVKKQMASIDKEIKKTGYNNIYEVLGISISKEKQGALNDALGAIKDTLGGLIDSWLQVAEAATAAADAQVDAAQKALDAEIEARNAGYANNVETMQKELAEAKKNRDKALKEEEKAKKAQIALDSVQQASSLITASANIWAAFGGVFPIGPALAAAAIVAMWASFAMSKAKALQATKSQSYGEGTVELLEGGSHASGHDIDMGRKKDGTRRRAEGGEYFAIINKRNSRRYRKEIPEIINALNDGTFADKYQRAGDRMSGMAIEMGGVNLGRLEKDVSAIRQQGEEQRYIDGTGRTVIKYHNLTRRIYS